MAAESPVGTRIKKRRQVLRMTQAELAAQLGVSKSAVANWETGKHFPSRYQGAIEELLSISLDGDGPDPLELEIRDLAARLELSAAEEQRLIDRHRANQRRAEPGIAS